MEYITLKTFLKEKGLYDEYITRRNAYRKEYQRKYERPKPKDIKLDREEWLKK